MFGLFFLDLQKMNIFKDCTRWSMLNETRSYELKLRKSKTNGKLDVPTRRGKSCLQH